MLSFYALPLVSSDIGGRCVALFEVPNPEPMPPPRPDDPDPDPPSQH